MVRLPVRNMETRSRDSVGLAERQLGLDTKSTQKNPQLPILPAGCRPLIFILLHSIFFFFGIDSSFANIKMRWRNKDEVGNTSGKVAKLLPAA